MKMFLFFVTFGLVIQYSMAGKCPSNQPIRNVAVVHRRVNLSTTGGCYLSHSGLLLQLADGKSCVLEYSTDGKATLSAASPFNFDMSCWFKKCYIVDTYDNKDHDYWRTEEKGVPLSQHLGAVSPTSARNQMQDLIGDQFHLLKRNSHQAQQKLRTLWGLPVHKTTYDTNPSFVCSCVTRMSSYLVPPRVRQIYQTTKEACREVH
ncbi:uncharacterized protein LOC116307508 [Actinia tenebrosa]|uniref:Uncharacterized protein LOC116307508 n=1 Tax=Actinia tenebrosa TaxID=6105 RepID=A0A6P8J173_ACTTE|nr:uncharacterized protein LOC116307508 [Actinia tenebrosa]